MEKLLNNVLFFYMLDLGRDDTSYNLIQCKNICDQLFLVGLPMI